MPDDPFRRPPYSAEVVRWLAYEDVPLRQVTRQIGRPLTRQESLDAIAMRRKRMKEFEDLVALKEGWAREYTSRLYRPLS